MYPHISKSDTPAFVTISSSAALAPIAGTAPYTAAKSASKALTECFALSILKSMWAVFALALPKQIYSPGKKKISPKTNLSPHLCQRETEW